MNRFRRSCWWGLGGHNRGGRRTGGVVRKRHGREERHPSVCGGDEARVCDCAAGDRSGNGGGRAGVDGRRTGAGGDRHRGLDRAALAAQPGVLGVGAVMASSGSCRPSGGADDGGADAQHLVAGPFAKLSSAVVADPAFHLPGCSYDRINAAQRMAGDAGQPERPPSRSPTPALTTRTAICGRRLDCAVGQLHHDRAAADLQVRSSAPVLRQGAGGRVRRQAQPRLQRARQAGAIGAATNGVGTNGLAPNVRLVALKISQWCGSAYDSELISAFIWAADHGVDVVNISFVVSPTWERSGAGRHVQALPGRRGPVRADQRHHHRRLGG